MAEPLSYNSKDFERDPMPSIFEIPLEKTRKGMYKENPFLEDDSVPKNIPKEKNTPMIPSRQEYKGEKINYEKGALRKIIETTQNLTIEQTIEKLEKYTKPSKESGDMFEMVALYQRSIQHLTILKIRVDARFGPRTFEKLMKTQKEVLKFEWKAVDGIPGPKTTQAIIDALKIALDKTQKKDNTPEKIVDNTLNTMDSAKKTIEDLQRKIGTDNTPFSLLWRDKTKTFLSWTSPTDIKYAYITEGTIVSVWGEINTANKTRPLILMEWGKVIYVGELSPNGTLADKTIISFPEWKNKKDYWYMPVIPKITTTNLAK